MIKKVLLATLTAFLSSCSVTLVYAPKSVCNHGHGNETMITGSDLKGNRAEQSSTFDWIVEIPEKLGW